MSERPKLTYETYLRVRILMHAYYCRLYFKKAKKAYGFIWFQYFQLDKVLDSQYLESEAAGNRVDEEHLFIIVHQGSQKSIREMYPLLSCLTTAELSTILDISHTHLCIQIE